MINYWNNLNERERWMVGGTSIAAIVYLFYLLIYSPLTNAVNSKSAQLLEKKETLAWMKQVEQKPRNKKERQTLSNAKLLAQIGGQLSSGSLRQFPYQLQQTGQGDIQLSFDQVPMIQFLTWLWTVNNDYAIVLKQFSAEQTETSGVVKLTVVIAAT